MILDLCGGLQLVQRFSDQLRKEQLVGLADPPVESELEHGDPASSAPARVGSGTPRSRNAGLRRGELVTLRWRDVDFPGQAIRVRVNYSFGELETPKSGKVRTVPMVPDVAQALARLGQRELFTGDEDPVFAGPRGGHLDASALRRRYTAAVQRAGLCPLPFHSLRHYFGSMAVKRASLVQVQSWMGHSHIQTTARYLHAKSQADDAALLAGAVAPPTVQDLGAPGGVAA